MDGMGDPFDQIMVSFFGASYDPSVSWENIGMSSMVSVQLRDAIVDSFATVLGPDCFEVYNTPVLLKAFVLGNLGLPLDVYLPNVALVQSMALPWWLMVSLQALGSMALLFLFAFYIVPAWYVGAVVTHGVSVEIQALNSEWKFRWMWVPIVVPTWMVSFSLSVILMKWMVI